MKFAEVTKGTRPPARTLVLEPWVFADDWGQKPREPICVGLRLMSEADKTRARREAEDFADELHKKRSNDWLDARNDYLVRQVVAVCLCDPNDVSKPSQILPYAEEQVRFALTSRGAAFIFHAYDQYELETSPLEREATDGDLAALGEILLNEPAVFTKAQRRLLAHVLDDVSEDAD